MRKSTRKSSIGELEARNSTANFSTRFSLPSFIKQVRRLTDDQRAAIGKTGFGNLLLMPNQTLSKSLLDELMRRWSVEKQAFVLPNGEIHLPLLDIALILGLHVIGAPVLLNDNEPYSDLESEYGAVIWKRKITIASLESRLDSLGGICNDDFIRTFLLYTFGTFLSPNANGKIDSRFLSFFKDVDHIFRFAWGAAVLEDIITWLDKRKEMNVQYVGGCLLVLQIWSFEHIDIARPALLGSSVGFPRVCHWDKSRSHNRKQIMEKFKDLKDYEEEDLKTRVRMLEEQNMELEKEIYKLRRENGLLRNQLSGSELKETNVELKREIDELGRENQRSKNLVIRLEKLLLDEDINRGEESNPAQD